MSHDLRPGHVVRRKPTTNRYQGNAEDRGVVVWVAGGDNALSYDGLMRPCKGEVKIRFGAGHHLFTTYASEWERVPEQEWTASERVWSVNASYRHPTWYEDDDRVPDYATYEWALVCALLPPHHVERVFPENGDSPTDWMELAEAIAYCQDFDRAAAEATFS